MAGQTISTAVSGQDYLTASSTPLTITSTGSITTAASGDAISGGSGTLWHISNAGTISGTIGSSSAGIYLQSAGSTVQNTGKIYGATAGIWLSHGGDVTNSATGLITATGSYGVYIGGGPGVVTNAGTITGGWYAVDLSFSSASNRLVVAPGAVFNGLVSGGNGTLELASGASSGSITGLNTGSFQNFAALVVDAGASWTLSGSNTIASVTDDGSLVITGALPAATYQIGAAGGGGTLEVASAPSAASPISFLGNSKLIIDSAAGFGANVGSASYTGPLLEGFVSGDTIDITSFSAANASYTYNSVTGLLQIVNGSQTASLDFQTSTLGSGAFSLTSDGGTGLDVTLSQATAPAAPTIASPASGSIDTTTAEPVISGTGVSGDTVSVSIDGSVVGTALVSNGAWSYTPTSPLSNASHSVTATQAAAGGPSSAPSAADTFTVNVPTAPAAPTIASPASGSIDTTTAEPVISGTGVSGDTVSVSIDGSVVGTALVSNGAWSYTPTSPLSNASHSVTATQAAAGGPSSAPSAADTFTVNVPTAPAAPTIASPASGSIDTTTAEPVISGTGVSGDTVSVSIDGSVVGTALVSNGAWSYTPTSPLSNASHSVTATQAAAGGPSSAPSAADTFTVNVPTAPAAPTIASPASGSIDTTTAEPVISGTGVSGDTVSVSIDGSVVGTALVSNGAWSYTPTSPLSNASHSVTATQAAAGGPSSAPSAADTFTVNVPTAPAAPTIASPASGSIDTTTAEPVISGTGVSGDTVSVSIDGSVVGTALVSNGAWSYTPTSPLSNASHSVTATQAAAGGPSSAPSAADTFTVNVPTAPAAPTIASPASGSIDTTTAEPVISGTGVSGDTVSVSIDGSVVGTALVSNGAWSYTPTSPLSNASHSVTATQAAAGGPSSAPSAADTFTVNVPTAPAAPTIASPASGSIDTTTAEPVISGTGVSGDTVSVSIDGSVVGTALVSNGAWSYTPTSPLSNASHSVTATQAAAGGPSSAPSAADTFTVNVSSGGLTISSAITGPLTLAATNNPLTITSAGSVKATASGADAIDGASGTTWSITNAGTVASSQRYGISLHSASGSIVNSGSISGYSGSSGYGVDLEDGGTITNTSTGSITGGEDAIFVYGAPGTIDNRGKIISSFDDGIGLFAGGSVTNRAGALIQAPTGGGYGPAAVYIPAGSASVTNYGVMSGQYGVYFGVAGTVENAGTISGTSHAVEFAASSSANRLIVDPGAVFNGGVSGNGGVLELTAGTGSIGLIGSSAFSGFKTLSDDASALWTLTGTNTIADVTDNGGLTIAGSLDVSGAVNSASAGQFDLQSGGSLEVAADTAAHSQIDFLGASELIIDSASLFGTGVGGSAYGGPLLENFVAGDTIDLHGFVATAAALLYNPANGLLQITNGASQVATLDFKNSTLGTGGFSFASDGNGGILIKHS